MALEIRKAAVLGAGVMGSGIAAHLANAGIEVFLLDIVPKELTAEEKKAGLTLESPRVRSRLALNGVENARRARPPAFYDGNDAALIRCGNLEDHLGWLAGADWICEAVVENLKIKTAVFEAVARHRKAGSIVSSNTSGIFVRDLVKGMAPEMRRSFFVTHFFNPVRHMRLLELVPGEETDMGLYGSFAAWAEERLGKGVVHGKDTPNFVANRIGVYYLQNVLRRLEAGEMPVEQIDAVLGPPAGRPSSAVFRTFDIIGLDTHHHVTLNVYEGAPQDEERALFKPPAFLEEMIRRGWLGDKSGKTGFYKVVAKEGGGKAFWKLDLGKMEHVPPEKKKFASVGKARDIEDPAARVKKLVEGDDEAARLAWGVLSDTICYSARRIPEIADDVVNIDNGMRWGWAWELGPFETWDAFGLAEAAARLEKEGRQVPPLVREVMEKGEGKFYTWKEGKKHAWDTATKGYVPVRLSPSVLPLRSFKDRGGVVHRTASASLIDIGEGVLLLEFHSKMNTLDEDMGQTAERAFEKIGEGFQGLVICNEDPRVFTAGANLMLVMMCIGQKDWTSLEKLVRGFQGLNMRMKRCEKPVVAAPFGLAIGGGMEMTLHSHGVQAHAELTLGLVETGVGLIPAGGGTKELVLRMVGKGQELFPGRFLPGLAHAFECIATAKMSGSAKEAFELGYLDPRRDAVTMNRDHLVFDARRKVLELARTHIAPKPATVALPGEGARLVLEQAAREMQRRGILTEYETVIASKLAFVMTGGNAPAFGPVTEQQLLDLECEAFLSLCGEPKTVERISHTLTTGKPLRN